VYEQDMAFSKNPERIIVTKDDGSQQERDLKVPVNSHQLNKIEDKKKQKSSRQTSQPAVGTALPCHAPHV